MKATLLVLISALVLINATSLRDEILDDLIERFRERKMQKDDDLDPRFCEDTGLVCERCSECHDHLQFGLCIVGATSSRCLCKWGWTGSNAKKLTDAGISQWSTNRIRADHCKKPCHYTHDVWNPKCLSDFNFPECDEDECKATGGRCINDKCVPQCDEDDCKDKGGRCVEGKCKICCKNLNLKNHPYVGGDDFKDYCDARCHRDCGFDEIPHCNPKCALSGGKCNELTGRCECCKDFTGPRPLIVGNKITADYCSVHCPYKNDGKPNLRCANPDYVERLSAM